MVSGMGGPAHRMREAQTVANPSGGLQRYMLLIENKE
jgi:hypothetical protein